MEQSNNLTTNDKIRLIRESMDITQSAIAQILENSVPTVSRLDNNTSEYTTKQLKAVRKSLGIENVPLHENEYSPFKDQLYSLNALIKEDRFDEARKKCDELSVITHLSFEPDLIMLYKMFEAKMFLGVKDIDSARNILESYQHLLDTTTTENKYRYYYNMGMLNSRCENFDEALKFYLMAQTLESDDFDAEPYLYYNIAICDAFFGRYVLAVCSYEQIYQLFSNDKASVSGMHFDNNLGLNYMKIGQLEQAKFLFDRGLARARGLGNKTFIAYITHNHGCVCFKAKKFQEAIDYFDQASEQFEKGSIPYFENLYYKILCLIATKNPLAKMELSGAKTISQGNEYYSILFDGLTYLPLKAGVDVEHIMKMIIPKLLGKFDYCKVLDYYELFEDFYGRKSRTSKVMEIQALTCKVYKKIMSRRDNR